MVSFFNSEEQEKLEEQRKWIDAEVEKVLEQRRKNDELDQVCGMQIS